MDTITYTAARAKLARTMDRVCEDHEPLIITRNGQQDTGHAASTTSTAWSTRSMATPS